MQGAWCGGGYPNAGRDRDLQRPSNAGRGAALDRAVALPDGGLAGLVWGLGFGILGLGFGVWGLGFGVWGLGFVV